MPQDKQTMWLIPGKLPKVEPWNLVQILSLFDAVSAGPASKLVSKNLHRRLSELGVKVFSWSSGVVPANLLRLYLPEIVFLGLFFHRSRGEWILTNAGEALIAAENPLDVLRCQLLRLQFPSTYTSRTTLSRSTKLRIKFCSSS